jgi:hypothetical protein
MCTRVMHVCRISAADSGVHHVLAGACNLPLKLNQVSQCCPAGSCLTVRFFLGTCMCSSNSKMTGNLPDPSAQCKNLVHASHGHCTSVPVLCRAWSPARRGHSRLTRDCVCKTCLKLRVCSYLSHGNAMLRLKLSSWCL